jgi:hypothetical protein
MPGCSTTTPTYAEIMTIVELEAYGPDFTADPYPYYERLRAVGPPPPARGGGGPTAPSSG